MRTKGTMTRWRKKCVAKAKEIRKILDNYTCQKCQKYVTGISCHGSHVVSEARNKKLSCDIMNIKVLCAYCHRRFWHEQPLLSAEWFNEAFPWRAEYLLNENRKGNGSIGKQYFIDKYDELCRILDLLKAEDNGSEELINKLLDEADPKFK